MANKSTGLLESVDLCLTFALTFVLCPKTKKRRSQWIEFTDLLLVPIMVGGEEKT